LDAASRTQQHSWQGVTQWPLRTAAQAGVHQVHLAAFPLGVGHTSGLDDEEFLLSEGSALEWGGMLSTVMHHFWG